MGTSLNPANRTERASRRIHDKSEPDTFLATPAHPVQMDFSITDRNEKAGPIVR